MQGNQHEGPDHMPTIAENKTAWTGYDWSKAGEEWSASWGSAAHQWAYTWLSRVAAFLPASAVLEIAPGFGRWSRFLIDRCETYYGIDLAEPAIEACRRNFASQAHARFIVNDGRSLPDVPLHTIDFAFSADSLVHADREAMAGYIHALHDALRPGGAAFLHHSNLGACPPDTPNPHWRDPTVSAEWVRETCHATGMSCQAQELICWGQAEFNDCFTLLVNTPPKTKTLIRSNPDFGAEIGRCRQLAELYSAPPTRRRPRPSGPRQPGAGGTGVPRDTP